MKHLRFIPLLLALSCSEQTELQPVSVESGNAMLLENVRGQITLYGLPNEGPYGIHHVYKNSNNQYVSNYGNSFNFGSTFIHPTSPETMEPYGTPYAGVFVGGLQSPNNFLGYDIVNNSRINAYYGTFLGGVTVNAISALNDYREAVDKYYSEERDTVTNQLIYPVHPLFSTYAQRYQVQTAEDGVITISGVFIHDSSSPTNISIADVGFTPGGPPILGFHKTTDELR